MTDYCHFSQSVKWQPQVCEMTGSSLWYDEFKSVKWQTQVCEMTDSSLWYDKTQVSEMTSLKSVKWQDDRLKSVKWQDSNLWNDKTQVCEMTISSELEPDICYVFLYCAVVSEFCLNEKQHLKIVFCHSQICPLTDWQTYETTDYRSFDRLAYIWNYRLSVLRQTGIHMKLQTIGPLTDWHTYETTDYRSFDRLAYTWNYKLSVLRQTGIHIKLQTIGPLTNNMSFL